MELILFIAAVVVIALAWTNYVKNKKTESNDAIDSWTPNSDKPWPYGEKVAEGKIHVKPSDVAGSENRVETPAPALAVDGHGDVHEVKPAKKAPAKKTADKKPAVKKAPAKKKST